MHKLSKKEKRMTEQKKQILGEKERVKKNETYPSKKKEIEGEGEENERKIGRPCTGLTGTLVQNTGRRTPAN